MDRWSKKSIFIYLSPFLSLSKINFFKDFIYLFLQRGKEREIEEEKHQCVVASHMSSIGDLAHNPGMCPDWESNWRPFGSQLTLNPLNYISKC